MCSGRPDPDPAAALGAAFGYAQHGATGALIGGLAGLALALLVGGAPLALLFGASRGRLERERRLRPQDRTD